MFSLGYLRNIHFFFRLLEEYTFFSLDYLRNIHFSLDYLRNIQFFFRLLEEGNITDAEKEKSRIESLQRDSRKKLESAKEEYRPVWFRY